MLKKEETEASASSFMCDTFRRVICVCGCVCARRKFIHSSSEFSPTHTHTRSKQKTDDDNVGIANGWRVAGNELGKMDDRHRLFEHLRIDWSKMNTTHCEGWRMKVRAMHYWISFIQTIMHNWWMTQTRLCNTWMNVFPSVHSPFFPSPSF